MLSLVASVFGAPPFPGGIPRPRGVGQPWRICSVARYSSAVGAAHFSASFRPTDDEFQVSGGRCWKLLDPDIVYSLASLESSFVADSPDLCPARIMHRLASAAPRHRIVSFGITDRGSVGVWRSRGDMPWTRYPATAYKFRKRAGSLASRNCRRATVCRHELWVVPGIVASDAAFNNCRQRHSTLMASTSLNCCGSMPARDGS